jgi:regulator of cell morphogenesis and NO signaling
MLLSYFAGARLRTMQFTFSAHDPVAAFLERFVEAPDVLRGLGVDPLRDLECPVAIDEDGLDRLALRLRVLRWNEDEDWTSADLEDLIQHIVATHHTYLSSELPRLCRLARRLAVIGGSEAAELEARLGSISDHLSVHLHREENILFPVCRALARNSCGATLPDEGVLHSQVHDLEVGHEHSERELLALIALTRRIDDDYRLPGIREALISDLASLTEDLRQHHHEEEDCLLPAALHYQVVLSRPLRNIVGHP